MRSLTALVARLVVGVLAVVGILGLALFFAVRALDIDSLNPFREETTDNSQPVLVQSVRDLAKFTAAEGNFQEVIDLQNSRGLVPDFLLGDRRVLVASGSVDVTVDFSALGSGAIKVVDEDTVRVRLPAPELSTPKLDLAESTFTQDRGLVNRLGDLVGSNEDNNADLYALAEKRISSAATQADLTGRAESNTKKTLTGLFGSLGYDDVRVTFEGGADDR